MLNPNRTDNAPDRPPKPPDIPSNLTGHPPSTLPSPHTGLTPPESSLTPQNSLPCAATLGLNPSEAATITTVFEHTGSPPVDAPPPGDQFGGSYVDQSLALADTRPGPTRGSPHNHGPAHGSIPQFPASSSHAPTWVESPPALDGQPDAARPLLPSHSARTTGPAHSGPQAAPAQLPITGVPSSIGLPLNQMIEPNNNVTKTTHYIIVTQAKFFKFKQLFGNGDPSFCSPLQL
ncbi:hypothetical protein Fot_11939 [Forsythia ovata]|uniref:Uncharacterized protein n=1 Tax=Forsythia ovata TaxID=205694 RepID=A0ABD1WL42_9LAMI